MRCGTEGKYSINFKISLNINFFFKLQESPSGQEINLMLSCVKK